MRTTSKEPTERELVLVKSLSKKRIAGNIDKASKDSGIPASTAYKMVKRDRVRKALERRLERQLDNANGFLASGQALVKRSLDKLANQDLDPEKELAMGLRLASVGAEVQSKLGTKQEETVQAGDWISYHSKLERAMYIGYKVCSLYGPEGALDNLHRLSSIARKVYARSQTAKACSYSADTLQGDLTPYEDLATDTVESEIIEAEVVEGESSSLVPAT